jgi:hypothetical protein
MMTLTTIVSQPVWILVTLVGAADVLILLWCIALIRKNRNRHVRAADRDEFAVFPEQSMPSGQFQQSLTDLQVDAVFDGLAALIETERIKLKSMIRPVAAPVSAESATSDAAGADDHDSMDEVLPPPKPEPPLDHQIARIADSGMKPTAIAGRLGISVAEVNLALRMRSGARSAAGSKLEAVA